MKKLVKYSIVKILIVCYTSIGFAGHYPALDEVSNYFINSNQLSKEAKSYPLSFRPIWTKKKHYAPNVQTKIFLSISLFSTIDISDKNSSLIQFVPTESACTFLLTPSAKPRDPPIA
jgi:hypothetical protein